MNTHEAKSRLSELFREAEQVTDGIAARNGRPVAKIVAWTGASSTRVPGSWSGQVVYGEDIVGSDEDIVEMFEDRDGDLPATMTEPRTGGERWPGAAEESATRMTNRWLIRPTR